MNGSDEGKGPDKPDTSGKQNPEPKADAGQLAPANPQQPAAAAGKPADAKQATAPAAEKPAPPAKQPVPTPAKRGLSRILSALGGGSATSSLSQQTKDELLRLAAKELGGRTIAWWRGVVHDEMLRAKRAEDALARAREELAAAFAAASVAASKISELNGRVAVLEQRAADANAEVKRLLEEMRSYSKENEDLRKEVESLETEVESLRALAFTKGDFDTIFSMVVGPFQEAYDNLRAEVYRQ